MSLIVSEERDTDVHAEFYRPHEPGAAHRATVGGEPMLSPSLLAGARSPAYEMKFVLTLDQAAGVVDWACEHLRRDSHGDLSLGGGYAITSIYMDTPGQSVFKRDKGYRQHKFRVRRYGNAHHYFLERKTKSNGQVSKVRSRIQAAELDVLTQDQVDSDWTGAWFCQNLERKTLSPAAIIRYQRQAFVGTLGDKPVRLTLDNDIHFSPRNEFDFCHAEDTIQLVPNQMILELKFCQSIPAAFKSLIGGLRITPGSLSKYRQGMAVWNAAHSLAEGACA